MSRWRDQSCQITNDDDDDCVGSGGGGGSSFTVLLSPLSTLTISPLSIMATIHKERSILFTFIIIRSSQSQYGHFALRLYIICYIPRQAKYHLRFIHSFIHSLAHNVCMVMFEH